MKPIEFNKTAHDPQIDFIKGLCIIFVVWTHCMYREELRAILFPYWGDTAVPLFLLIQVFHYFKKGTATRMPSPLKLLRRIVWPFVAMLAAMFLFQYFLYYDATQGAFSLSLYWDKRGPGSYYIFVYLEFALLLPLLAPLFRRLSVGWLFVLFLVLSQITETVCSLTQCPDSIYRITFFRYIFLIFLGYLLATRGITLNWMTITLGIVGMLFIFLFSYAGVDMQPLFCTNLGNWPLCHWICYFYIASLFLGLLQWGYAKVSRFRPLAAIIEQAGIYSYQVYLFQIFYYATVSMLIGRLLAPVESHAVQRLLYIALSTVICLLPAMILYVNRQRQTH